MKIDFATRALQLIPDMVAYLDTELRYRYTNNAYQKALQRSAEEFTGKTAFEILPAEIATPATPKWQEALKGKEVAYDTRLTIESGRTIWIFVRLMPELHEDGSVAGFFVFVTDVTARKEIESRLQRLRVLNDDLPSLLAHCDAHERYLYVNRAYASTYQRTPESILGLHVQEVVAPQLYDRIRPHISNLLRGESTEFETIIPHADGTKPWMSIRGIPERSGSEVIGFFVNVTDISKHKELDKLQSEFASGTVRAQEAERKALAQELHDGIAQELAALAVISNMLERKADSDKARSLLKMLQDGLQRTVDETRRLSYGLHPLELHERGLVNAIEELLNRTRQVHPNVAFNFICSDAERRMIAAADADIAVYRIVQESLSNALRHANPSHIEVSLMRESGLLMGTIIDDGSGFDTGLSHAGLGLVSMKERALLLDGTLRIHSSGTGTRIEFKLPTNPKTSTAI